MIRSTTRRLVRRLGRRDKGKLRGVRPEVPLPFDMFDGPLGPDEARAARKLAGIYHKGQAKAWNGEEVLAELLERHGGVQLSDSQRQAVLGLFAVILWGELAAWKISADLARQLEPLEAKLAATSQAHDEARHFYVMHDYLEVVGQGLPPVLGPHTEAVLTGTLQADSLVKKLMGMQMMIEPMALALFQIVREQRIEPVLCELLALYQRDEARHVALGVLHLPKLVRGLSLVEAADLWSWEFREFWKQLRMLRELEPHFVALGIDPRRVVDVGRAKQVKANQMLMDELGYELGVYPYFLRFFDAKAEWEFPRGVERGDYVERLRAAVRAGGVGDTDVPELVPA
jgi:hypothetical protein